MTILSRTETGTGAEGEVVDLTVAAEQHPAEQRTADHRAGDHRAGDHRAGDHRTPGHPGVDGRTLRAQRTRDAVVEALLALQEEGDLNPTAQRVAARAGVALRTVYGHFSDMESLYLEAGRRELVKITQLADVPPADLPLEERIARTAASRARTSEALLPVLRAARLRLPYSEALQRNWQLFIELGDSTMRSVFARELTAAGARADELLDALYLVVSATAWDALRAERRLEPDAAAEVVRRSVTALLAPYDRDDSPTDSSASSTDSEGPR